MRFFLISQGSLNLDSQLKSCDQQLEIKNVLELSKNAYKKRKNENFEKQMRFFLVSQGSFNPKISFLGQKVCSVAWLQTNTYQCYIRKKLKNAYKKRKNENFGKQKKKIFFLISQGSLNPKIRFLCQKVRPVARSQTDSQSDY